MAQGADDGVHEVEVREGRGDDVAIGVGVALRADRRPYCSTVPGVAVHTRRPEGGVGTGVTVLTSGESAVLEVGIAVARGARGIPLYGEVAELMCARCRCPTASVCCHGEGAND